MRSYHVLNTFENMIILHGKIGWSPVRFIIEPADRIHTEGIFVFKALQILHRERRAGCDYKAPFALMLILVIKQLFVFISADAALSEESLSIYNSSLKGKLNAPVKKIYAVERFVSV